MWNRLLTGAGDWGALLAALLPTLLVAWLAARLARQLAGRALHALVGDRFAADSPVVRHPLRLASLATFVLVLAVLLFPALEVAGLNPTVGRKARDIAGWLFGSGLRVGIIVLIAAGLRRAAVLLVQRFEDELTAGATIDDVERDKRARTLGSIVNTVATGLIVGTAGILVLNEIGVNVAPVLTGAGIAGIAIGFGAQTLVRDLLGGFLLILEDQVRVGDVAEINGTSGLVEQLNLRTIVLRDIRGTVHVFPNGGITTLANHSKDFSCYVIDLDIPYDEDPDRVADVARDVDRDMRSEPTFETLILEPVEIVGVVGYGQWSMQLRIRMKTVAQRQWVVGREFRKRLRKALNRHGIEVPYPILRPGSAEPLSSPRAAP
jgi:small conductance mechanosensitive channel